MRDDRTPVFVVKIVALQVGSFCQIKMAKGMHVKREVCIRRISKIHDTALKAESSPQHKSILLACYPDVAHIVDDFEVAHLKIIQDSTFDFEAEDEIRAQFDKMYYQIKAFYHTLESASRSAATVSITSTPISKIKLPQISLPHFSGDLALWSSFIALYNTSIHNNPQVTAIEKYQYLLVSLTGEALNLVKNLPLSADHYAIAYDSLVSRYQNKRKLATHYWRLIVDAKSLRIDSADSLRKLLDTFNENLRALHLMKFPTESWDFILLNVLSDKLIPSLREKFEAEHRKIEIPRYEQLTDFLGEYCRVFTSLPSSSDKSGDGAAKNHNRNSRPTSSVSSFVTGTAVCPICEDSHVVAKCPSFLKLSEKDRYSKAKALKLCLNCLRLGHRVRSCPSTWHCRSCKAKHHTLLHFE